MRQALKRIGDLLCAVLVAPAALTCWCEKRLWKDAESCFGFWAQVFALVPGPPGIFVRRAFYRQTLDACSRSFYVGFGAMFTHRCSVIEEDVFVGSYALIGSAHLSKGCLIGSRASLLSGPNLHQFADGQWLPADLSRLVRLSIGAHTWIGEGAVVLADVGSTSVVAAGSVVTGALPPGIVVGGNPARFVRRLAPEPETAPAVEAS